VSVDGSTSGDFDGDLASYTWEFGDGAKASGVRPAAHTYAGAGTYTITLTVADSKGAKSAVSQRVSVPAGGGGTTTPPATAPAPNPATPPASQPGGTAGGGPGAQSPDRVTGLAVVKASKRSITIKYRKSANAKNYRISVKQLTGKKKAKKWKSVGTTTRAKFTIKRLKPSTKYAIKVVARNSAGNSPAATIKARTRR
jgi:chitodextrinase